MARFATKTNSYASLDIPDTGETENLTRKAKKKLREIEKLKLKPKKTPEEYEKIRDEHIWKAIATPADAIPSETEEQIAERKAKQREKTKLKEQQQKQKKEKEKHKQEINLLKKKSQEEKEKHKQEINLLKKKFQEEMEKKNRTISELKEENAKMKKIITSNESKLNTSESQISTIIENEYHKKYQALGTHKKTWREMMRKYHPDKFKENKELANAFSIILNQLKEKYRD